MSATVPRTRVVLAVAAAAGALALAGCGAGQIAQTSVQASGVEGASANIGQIAVRGVVFTFTGNGTSAVIYPSGGSAPLSMTVVNFGAQSDTLTGASSPAADSVRITGDGTISAGKELLVEGAPALAPTPEAAPTSGSLSEQNTNLPAAGATSADVRPPTAAPATSAAAVTGEGSATTEGLPPGTERPTVSGSPISTPTPSAEGTTTAQVVLTGLKQDIKAGLTYPVVLTFQRAGDVTVQVPVGDPRENGIG